MNRFVCGLGAIACIVGAAASASSAAVAEPRVHVYAVRGFAGVAFSRGLNNLCEELARTPEVVCTVEDFYNEKKVLQAAAAVVARGEQLVLVGHSLGAHAVLRIGAAVNTPVPLIVSIDPNWFPEPPVVPNNAAVVLNYYQDYDVLGRAKLQARPSFRGQLLQYVRKEPHVMIDRSAEIHAEIASRISAILAQLTAPPPSPPPPAQRQRKRAH